MIKIIITTFLAMTFFIIKKIFVRKNRVPHKIMDNIANKLHSVFIFTSIPAIYISIFDIYINSFSLNTSIQIFLFLQFVLVIRYFNPPMLIDKELQVKIVRKINKLSLLIFITNWIFISFGFSILFLIVLLINNIFYVFIINQIKKQKEQEEFRKQFGDGDFSKDDIINKHVINLFETNLSIDQLTRSEIKKQYRIMAKRYHPDVYKGDEKDKFVSINSSYKFLLDLVK
jgi:hypothetical protein